MSTNNMRTVHAQRAVVQIEQCTQFNLNCVIAARVID